MKRRTYSPEDFLLYGLVTLTGGIVVVVLI